METIEVPNYARNGSSLVEAMRRGIYERLSAFCVAQLRHLKLVTATFTSTFDLRRDSRESRRSMAKLSRVLERNLVKQSPYLAHSLKPGNASALISYVNNRIVLTVGTYGTDGHKEIARYTRFLQYLCRKYGVPMDPSCVIPVGNNNDVPFISISVYPMARYPRSLGHTTLTSEQYESWLVSKRTEFAAAGRDPDAVYADKSLWETTSPVVMNSNLINLADSGQQGAYQLAMFERFFTVLPELMKAVHTISRKFAYASDAFAIRADRSADHQSVDSPRAEAGGEVRGSED